MNACLVPFPMVLLLAYSHPNIMAAWTTEPERGSAMDEISWDFYVQYSRSEVWMERTQWLGKPVRKCPLDLWIYQEILFRTRPDVIIETGTLFGGSALFLASMCELLGNGRVISIDVDAKDDLPTHPRILFLAGSSIAPEIVDRVRGEITNTDSVMVILDSDHHDDHVLGELNAYGPLVTEDCYLIVEDTMAGFAPERWGGGPSTAIQEFMKSDRPFVIDPSCEKFGMTFNPGGYLKRVRG
jgi:cephalosporin hydroxylase